MKDPNVLEAMDLCVNGNPAEKDDALFIYELNCGIEYMLRLLRIPRSVVEKGSYVSRPIGEGPEPIIMPNGKKHFVTAYGKLSKELNDARKAYKNLVTKGKSNTKEARVQRIQMKKFDKRLKSIDKTVGQNQGRNCLSGNYEGCLQLRVKKEFSKFWKWLTIDQ